MKTKGYSHFRCRWQYAAGGSTRQVAVRGRWQYAAGGSTRQLAASSSEQ